MSPWTLEFEEATTGLVHKLVGTRDAAAWRSLMVRIAPRLEAWAKSNRLLRRCRLASDDDARAVMVAAFERLAANDYDNLRQFVGHAAPVEPPAHDLVADVIQLAKLDDDEPEAEPERLEGTHLRAWLLRLVDYVARDYVRRRLGWSDGETTKRAPHSDAMPLSDHDQPSARPPMTDRLTVAALVAEIREHLASFPSDMQTAVALWLQDADDAEIARRLGLGDPSRARALVRAAQARLRERFRGRSPVLFA